MSPAKAALRGIEHLALQVSGCRFQVNYKKNLVNNLISYTQTMKNANKLFFHLEQLLI